MSLYDELRRALRSIAYMAHGKAELLVSLQYPYMLVGLVNFLLYFTLRCA